MPRPKVPDDKRQRIAQACDSCKRRKQKCNGLRPCNTCQKKDSNCEYKQRTIASKNTKPRVMQHSKRRNLLAFEHNGGIRAKSQGSSIAGTVAAQQNRAIKLTSNLPMCPIDVQENSGKTLAMAKGPYPFTQSYSYSSPVTESTDRETKTENSGRANILQDLSTNLLSTGNPATLSYLQLVRTVVEDAIGPTPFTMDLGQNKVVEANYGSSPSSLFIYLLPKKDVAMVLLRSYLTNTCGLIDIFNQHHLHGYIESCYANPLSIDPPVLCLVYLVMAVGLITAWPLMDSPEDFLIKGVQDDPMNRAETLFAAAKSLFDLSNGFEDSGLLLVQILCLMCIYTLTVSRRNTACSYHEMAVHSAVALDLHRLKETSIMFDTENTRLRRNIWKSLFVLDKFLAASVGGLEFLPEDDCSEDSLEMPAIPPSPQSHLFDEMFTSRSLGSLVKSCRFISEIISKIYSKEDVSSGAAEELLHKWNAGHSTRYPSLALENVVHGTVTTDKGIAILHVHLFSQYAIILLTRPFLLHLMIQLQKSRSNGCNRPRLTQCGAERLSHNCVTTSTQSVALIEAAFNSGQLPTWSPFVSYFLFTAAIVILSNEFASLHKNEQYSTSISVAIDIMNRYAIVDKQAERQVYILKTFREAVKDQLQSADENLCQKQLAPEERCVSMSTILVNRRQGLETRPLTDSIGANTSYTRSHCVSHRGAGKNMEGNKEGISQIPMHMPRTFPKLKTITPEVSSTYNHTPAIQHTLDGCEADVNAVESGQFNSEAYFEQNNFCITSPVLRLGFHGRQPYSPGAFSWKYTGLGTHAGDYKHHMVNYTPAWSYEYGVHGTCRI